MLGDKELVYTLLFRATEHGWNGEDFHKRCDGRRPTVSLYRLTEGSCIGGFTNAQWFTPASTFFG
jgi:hypothetical protein